MNWDAIGAVGELVGAFTVVLTLGYLAVQVKQNTKGMLVAAKLEITNQYATYTDLVLKNPELFEIQRKGFAGEEMSSLEYGQFNLLMDRVTWHFSSMHYQYRSQNLSSDDWHESQRLIRFVCRTTGYRSWWVIYSKNYSPDFRNYVSELLVPAATPMAGGAV